MEITVEELLQGKGTIIKGKQYLATKKYVIPFIEKMKAFTTDFRVFVKTPDQMTIGNETDITYNRVLIQAKLNHKIDNMQECIFMVYGIDTKKPVAKFYKGYLDETDNLYLFNSGFLAHQEIEPEEPLVHNVKSVIECTDNTEAVLDQLEKINIDITTDNIEKLLGQWVRKSMYLEYNAEYGKIKLSSSAPIDAYKLLFEDRSSPYYINKDTKTTDLFHIYKAFAHTVKTDAKDLMNKFEKTILIGQLLNILK